MKTTLIEEEKKPVTLTGINTHVVHEMIKFRLGIIARELSRTN